MSYVLSELPEGAVKSATTQVGIAVGFVIDSLPAKLQNETLVVEYNGSTFEVEVNPFDSEKLVATVTGLAKEEDVLANAVLKIANQ